MLIESTTQRDKSIGSAYEYVLSLLQVLCEQYGEAAVFTGNFSLQVEAQAWGPAGAVQTAPKVANLSDAIDALLAVSEQGGGCPVRHFHFKWFSRPTASSD